MPNFALLPFEPQDVASLAADAVATSAAFGPNLREEISFFGRGGGHAIASAVARTLEDGGQDVDLLRHEGLMPLIIAHFL